MKKLWKSESYYGFRFLFIVAIFSEDVELSIKKLAKNELISNININDSTII